MATRQEVASGLSSARNALQVLEDKQKLVFCAACCLRVAPTLEAEVPDVDMMHWVRPVWDAAFSGGSDSTRVADLGADADDLVNRASDDDLGSAIDVALAFYHLVLGVEDPSELLEAAERAAWGASGNQGNPEKRRDFILEELQWQQVAAAVMSGVKIEESVVRLAVLCDKVPGWFVDFASRFPSASWTVSDRLRTELRLPGQ